MKPTYSINKKVASIICILCRFCRPAVSIKNVLIDNFPELVKDPVKNTELFGNNICSAFHLFLIGKCFFVRGHEFIRQCNLYGIAFLLGHRRNMFYKAFKHTVFLELVIVQLNVYMPAFFSLYNDITIKNQ